MTWFPSLVVASGWGRAWAAWGEPGAPGTGEVEGGRQLLWLLLAWAPETSLPSESPWCLGARPAQSRSGGG